jgi:cobalt-zinc-cadmium efflux system protein
LLARSHAHDDHSLSRAGDRQRLTLTLALVAAYLVAEVVGGLWTGSLALLADAGHMFSDAGALALSLFAIWLAQRPTSVERTFGYHRVEILAALANAVALVAVALLILSEAFKRISSPRDVLGAPMLAVAVGGLVVNLAGLWILQRGKDANLNVRGAWLHVLSDTLGSVGVIIAAFLVWALGWREADPIASIAIALLVIYASWQLLRETVGVLMEAAPGHIDVEEVRRALLETVGVVSIHDLHVWTITSGFVSLSCHVESSRRVPDRELLTTLQSVLRERFGIDHATIQIEPPGFEGKARIC